MTDPLERETSHLTFPIFAASLAAIFVFAVALGIVTQITGDAILPLSFGGAAAFPAFAIVSLRTYGVPPSTLAPKFAIGRDVLAFSGAIVAPLLAARSWAWVWGLAFALAAYVVSFGYLFKLANDTFRHLMELIPLGGGANHRAESGVLISHVSDVHITRADNVARAEGGRGGHAGLRLWLTSLELVNPALLVVSGDVTDTGVAEEWDRFEEQLKSCAERRPIVFAPGNHDLSTAYGSMTDDKLRRYFESHARLQPDVVTCDGERLGDVVARAEAEIAPFIEARAQSDRIAFIQTDPPSVHPAGMGGSLRYFGVRDRIQLARRTNWTAQAREQELNEWFNLHGYGFFPLQFTHAATETTLVILNSVFDPTDTLGDSALGHFSAQQLSRLALLLDALPDTVRNIVIVTHHAPFRHPGDWRAFFRGMGGRKKIVQRLWDYAFLAHRADEARQFLTNVAAAADRRDGVNVFILCGHRHTPTCGRLGRVMALEASSLSEDTAAAWLIFLQGGRVFVWNDQLAPVSADGSVGNSDTLESGRDTGSAGNHAKAG